MAESERYCAEVDSVDEAGWTEALSRFDDASIYQTWSYEEARSGRRNISHLLLKRDGEVVAMAQARLARIPGLNVGIAYVRWGPLWRARGGKRSEEIFRHAIRALRHEYSVRRGLVLRIYPAIHEASGSPFSSILLDERFNPSADYRTDRTLLIDLTRPLEELRKDLRPHWSRNLRAAERGGLEVTNSTDVESFTTFVKVYEEMVQRKRFERPNDIRDFASAQERLPSELKMRVLLCRRGPEVCAGVVCSAIGDTGVYLFGATGRAGLRTRGSYLLHWKLIEWLREHGTKLYDLNGIDPVRNPGTYRFKADLCGANGIDVRFLGRFESAGSALSNPCVRVGDWIRRSVRDLRRAKNATAEGPAGTRESLEGQA
jgi:hypothetical protein